MVSGPNVNEYVQGKWDSSLSIGAAKNKGVK